MSAFLGSSSCHGTEWYILFVRCFASVCRSVCLPNDWHVAPNYRSITLRVATLPSTFFDGTDTVTFGAVDVMGSPSTTSSSTAPSSDAHNDNGNSNTVAAGGASNTASFEVTFFHCAAGSFWNRELSGDNGSNGHAGTCEPCNENEADGETQVRAANGDGDSAVPLYRVDCYLIFCYTAKFWDKLLVVRLL